MENTCTVKIESPYSVKYARSSALRKCTSESPELNYDFMKVVRDRLSSMTTDEFDYELRKFIKDKGLRIISEKPVARAKDGNYVVEVYFTIAW